MGQKFSHTQYPIQALIGHIESGLVSLPDLQRPFVWSRSQVRNLFDSLYHGYPAGYFLFWTPTADIDKHAVAGGATPSATSKMIVDGQQRLTSLFVVMKGQPVLTETNETQEIHIAFNPLTEEFAVVDATKEHDPEWISNISTVWAPGGGGYKYTNDFIDRLAGTREVTEEERNQIGESIGELAGLSNYQFSALELSGDLDVDEVAEVFARINSTGTPLNSADFILTLMSVHHKDLRHERLS